jgi:hypothetical protein
LETEQAHSSRIYSGRDTVPQWRDPRTADDSDDAAPQHSRTAQRAVPTIWLNLICLDAPLVAVAWLWLFARTFHATVQPANCAALVLTAWLIYLADRLADSCSLPSGGPRSLRHEFCLRYRSIWIAAVAVIAGADAVLIWNHLGPATFLAGAIVGTLALIHLVLNYSLGGAWPPLPLKEAAVGTLFAAGTLVALFPLGSPVTGSLVFSATAFGLVCTLNCISIAYWERELDETQRKVSFATRFPAFSRHLGKLSIALAFGSGVAAMVRRGDAPILGCVAVSAFLLALLDFWRGRVDRDQRVALADLALLTPLLARLVMNA